MEVSWAFETHMTMMRSARPWPGTPLDWPGGEVSAGRSIGTKLLGGELPTNRLGGLVHPSYLRGRLAPTKIPLKSPGL